MSNENRFGMKGMSIEISVPVRFSETDAMGVVWHGNYFKFFEDAREKFGQVYQMEYLDMYRNGFFTPIVKSEIQHKASIFYGEGARIVATLEKHDAAKIIFRYVVYNETTGAVAATGMTMQVFMKAEDRSMEIIKPSFYSEWEQIQKWIDIE